jgi:hypothetical protein
MVGSFDSFQFSTLKKVPCRRFSGCVSNLQMTAERVTIAGVAVAWREVHFDGDGPPFPGLTVKKFGKSESSEVKNSVRGSCKGSGRTLY